jgi:hypothetical protein
MLDRLLQNLVIGTMPILVCIFCNRLFCSQRFRSLGIGKDVAIASNPSTTTTDFTSANHHMSCFLSPNNRSSASKWF